MTYAELVTQVHQLSLSERHALLNVIMQSVQEEFDPPTRLREAVLELRGIGQTDGLAPTDAELQEEYTCYLTEKYS